MQHNSFIGLYCTNENAERLQVQSTSIVDFELDLFNKHANDMSAITLDYVFKVMPPFTDTSVKKLLWQLLHILVLAQS